jgi:hypothetical protein
LARDGGVSPGDNDKDDLRFRLDWPEDDALASDAELSDFSFDWDDRKSSSQPAGAALPPLSPLDVQIGDEDDDDADFAFDSGEPEEAETDYAETFEDDEEVEEVEAIDDGEVEIEAEGDYTTAAVYGFEPAEPEPVSPVLGAVEPEPYEPTPELYDAPFMTDTEALDDVRRVLNEHNDALVQLSDAVYELASNVGQLLNEFRLSNPVGGAKETGSVAGAAMVKLTAAVEQVGEDLTELRAEMQGMADDVVAAAGGVGLGDEGSQPRVFVELDRLHNELQALKRRLPVRASGGSVDVDEIADRVIDGVLEVLRLEGGVGPLPTFAPRKATPAATKRAAPTPAPAPAPARAATKGKRQRPLRAD